MVRRTSVLCLVVLAIWLLPVASASAHSLVRRSDPADGATLQAAPAEVRVDFTEPPDRDLSGLAVLDATGATVADGGEVAERAPNEMVLAVPALPDGTYTISWRAVSLVDGHASSGSLAFGIGEAPVATGEAAQVVTSRPTAVSILGRVLLYLGLAIVLGAVAVAWLVAPRSKIPGWAVVSAAVAAAAGVVLSAFAAADAAGVAVREYTGTAAGTGLVRQGVAAGMLIAAAAAFVVSERRWALWVAGAAAVGVAVTHAVAGHAGAAGTGAVMVQSLHAIAAAAWIGGLGWLFAVTRTVAGRAAGEPDGGADDVRPVARIARRFSKLAAWLLATVVVTGAMRTIAEVGGPGALLRSLETGFGRALAIKLVVFAVLVAAAAAGRFLLLPRVEAQGSRRLMRLVAAEAVLGLVVFGVTAALSQLPPPASAAAPIAPAVVATGMDFATTVQAQLSAEPGSPGSNAFVLRMTDPDSDEVVTADRVALRFAMPERPEVGASTLELRAADEAWGATGANLSIAGTWQVTVVVERAEAGSVEVPLTLEVGSEPAS